MEGVLPSYLQLLIGVEGESLQRIVKLFCSLKTKITQDFARDCFVVSLLAALFLVALCTTIRTLPQHLYTTLFDHLSPTFPMCTMACSSFLPYLSPVPIYDLFAQHFSSTLFNLCVHCMRLNNVSRLWKLVWWVNLRTKKKFYAKSGMEVVYWPKSASQTKAWSSAALQSAPSPRPMCLAESDLLTSFVIF